MTILQFARLLGNTIDLLGKGTSSHDKTLRRALILCVITVFPRKHNRNAKLVDINDTLSQDRNHGRYGPVLTDLRKEGLIKAQPDPEDGRGFNYSMTIKGATLLKTLITSYD